MKKPIIIIGLGEMAGVFAKGFLRSGHPVYPITRKISIGEAFSNYPEPCLVLLAVAEKDFPAILKSIPKPWQNKLALLQNELLPDAWISQGIENPTVISVWFEKKKGQDVKVLLPSPAFGPNSQIITEALATLGIATTTLTSQGELIHALVMKNLFVLTINIAGLVVGGTTGKLLADHRSFTENIFNTIVTIQEALTNQKLDRARLFDDFAEALQADPDHKCKGRSAKGRLVRTLDTAKLFNIQTPALNKINITCSSDS